MAQEEILASGLHVGCDNLGHMLLIKLLDSNGNPHCVMMPSSIAIWYGKNRQKLTGGPYDTPPQPDILEDDWDGSNALIMTDMNAMQTGDSLSFLTTSVNRTITRITLPPPCHALLGFYLAEYWPRLVDLKDTSAGSA